MNEAKRVKPRLFMAVATAAVLSVSALGDNGIFVRPSDNARTWQVNVAPDSPIVWSWPDASTSARLVVTSFVEKTSAVYDIVRDEDSDSHEWGLPRSSAVTAEGEYLYDISLTIFGGEKVLQREFARIAYLPDTFSLLPAGTAQWRDITEERIFPYDAAWNGGQSESVAVSFSAEGFSPAMFVLPGKSGWEPMALARRFSSMPEYFSSAFIVDDETVYEAYLRRLPKGMVLVVR